MIRSLANLTAHKRSYCLERYEDDDDDNDDDDDDGDDNDDNLIMIRYEDVSHVFSSKAGAEAAGLQTVIVEGEVVETIAPGDIDTENYSPSLGSASQGLTVSNTSLF